MKKNKTKNLTIVLAVIIGLILLFVASYFL